MAQLIVELTKTSLAELEEELRTYEMGNGLRLKDVGSDGSQNYGVYDESFFLPEGAIKLQPIESDPPDEDAVKIETGRMIIGGEEKDMAVWRLPA